MPLRFGEFTLDESRRQLWKGATAVHLSPRAFQLLVELTRERPAAVSKKDLLQRLWPDTFVTEGNLAGLIAEVRSALEDDSHDPRYVRTHYGFGYSFAAEAQESVHALARPRRWLVPAVALPAVALIVIVPAIVVALWIRSTTRAPANAPLKPRSIAVLPFDTAGADHTDQHLGLSFADLVIARLSGLHDLVVRPTSAIRPYAAHPVDSREAGRKLEVDVVLEGTVRTSPDRVRVTVQLLDVHQQRLIWAGQFDEKRTDMFVIEDAIAEHVADALTVRLTAREKTRLTKRYTTNADAYNLYLEARYRQDQTIRSDHLDEHNAIQLMEQAVSIDPNYALAWASLGELYAANGAFNQAPPAESFVKAKAAVQRALELDDELPEAHCAAGVIKMYWDLDYGAAAQEFITTLQRDPRNTLAMMHYGRLLQCLGKFDEAIAMRKREIEIDPLNPGVQSHLAAAYVTARKDDLAIRQCQLVLRMDPAFSFAHTSLARLYAVRGEYEHAVAEAREAVRTEREGFQAKAMLGYVLAAAGRRSEATAILRELEREPKAQPFDVAIVHLALGQREEFYELLEKAVADRTYVLRLNTEPLFETCRSEPRFQALLRSAGFKTAARP